MSLISPFAIVCNLLPFVSCDSISCSRVIHRSYFSLATTRTSSVMWPSPSHSTRLHLVETTGRTCMYIYLSRTHCPQLLLTQQNHLFSMLFILLSLIDPCQNPTNQLMVPNPAQPAYSAWNQCIPERLFLILGYVLSAGLSYMLVFIPC